MTFLYFDHNRFFLIVTDVIGLEGGLFGFMPLIRVLVEKLFLKLYGSILELLKLIAILHKQTSYGDSQLDLTTVIKGSADVLVGWGRTWTNIIQCIIIFQHSPLPLIGQLGCVFVRFHVDNRISVELVWLWAIGVHLINIWIYKQHNLSKIPTSILGLSLFNPFSFDQNAIYGIVVILLGLI